MEHNALLLNLNCYFGYKHPESIMLEVRQVFRFVQQQRFMEVSYISTHFLSLVSFYAP